MDELVSLIANSRDLSSEDLAALIRKYGYEKKVKTVVEEGEGVKALLEEALYRIERIINTKKTLSGSVPCDESRCKTIQGIIDEIRVKKKGLL